MDYMDTLARCLMSAVILFIFTRLMGKKSIAHLTPFDYIAGITLGSISGSFSIDKRVGYVHGIMGIAAWSLLAFAVSYLSMKSMKIRKITGSTPAVLIQNGKIVEKNLRRELFNINDFLEELRQKGVFNLADVEFALLETNGKISVQMKSQKQPLTPSDLNMDTGYQGLSLTLIADGEIIFDNLKQVNLDEGWLDQELRKRGIGTSKDVMLASLDTSGKLYIDMKNNDPDDIKLI
ncbi:MAG: DUF421 domain-containing protein [Bacillota bacterium]|nr:DUF421 domain-containing protein [Bacillota bacterium]